jgi:hypothetical protein
MGGRGDHQEAVDEFGEDGGGQMATETSPELADAEEESAKLRGERAPRVDSSGGDDQHGEAVPGVASDWKGRV